MSEQAYSEDGGEQEEQQRSILNEKRARRLAEEDALRLFNRVRQLEKEEEKAEKRIAETQRKARDIVALRERNELKQQQKDTRLRELEDDIERQKAENLRLKDEIVRARTDAENAVYASKVNMALQGKEEHEQALKSVAETRLLIHTEAVEQKEAVQRAQEYARQRIEQLKVSKLQMAQDDYDKRLQGEVDAKTAKEREIEKLAQMELQLIERLKMKQREQRKAYKQLEAVLSLGSSTKTGSARPKSTTAAPPAAGLSASVTSEGAASGEPSEQDVARAFSVYDQDGTGKVSTADMGALLRDLQMALDAGQLSQAISQLDPDGAGAVSFGHFLMWWKG